MKYKLLIAFLLFVEALGAQIPRLYPASFIQFSGNYSFDNPAASSFHQRREIKLINSFYTGLLKNVGLYYLDASATLGRMDKATHTPGIVVHSEYETSLLRRSRVYLRYAWQTLVAEDWHLSAGLSFGFFNYAVQSTSSSAGTSVYVPDGNVGLWLHGKALNAGVSCNQLVSAEIKPVNRTFIAARYGTLLADYNFDLSPALKLMLAMRAYMGEQNYNGGAAAVRFTLSDHFIAGALFHYHRGAGFTIGINGFSLASVGGDLSFSYFQPFSFQNNLNSNRMEIMLRVGMNSEKVK